MKKIQALLLGVGFLTSFLSCQKQGSHPSEVNEFKIGIFGASDAKTHWVDSSEVFYEQPVVDGEKTSVYNVLVEDGFNIYQLYDPTNWTSIDALKSRLALTKAHGLQVDIGAGHWYMPDVDSSGNGLNSGKNIYDNFGNKIADNQHPTSQGYFRPDIDRFIDQVFNVSPYQDVIWGYHMCEEASYFHFMHFMEGGKGSKWGDPAYFKNIEIPPSNVKEAMDYFKERIKDKNKKIVLMEANHHKNVNANTKDHEGIYNSQDYIQLMDKNDKRDVYFEGSYTVFNAGDWLNQQYDKMYEGAYHYLGPFKSMDYAREYASDVHKIVNIEGTAENPLYEGAFHSDTTLKNGNFLWFQAYTGIIHEAKGVWFWDINFTRQKGEQNYWRIKDKADRFERKYFPSNYQNFVGPLAKELRYLVNNNFLSTVEKSILLSKTDQADKHNIVPEAASYIPKDLPADKRTEHYGLRYTVRSNGKESLIIVTNPLNVPVSATLNFKDVAVQDINSATGVDVLFENASAPVDSRTYKVDRNSGIDLGQNTVANQYYQAFEGDKQLALNFGPLDSKVLKFTKK
jgi:hypothetical protein